MAKIIFISYRRNDSEYITNFMYDGLTGRYGTENVLLDRTTIRAGIDFPDEIIRMATTCEVALVVMGPAWVGKDDVTGGPRIDKLDDFVRKEVELVLGRGIPVIPVLIQGMKMPSKDDLPPSMAPLIIKNAKELSATNFKEDLLKLMNAIDELPMTERELELERPERERRERERQEREAREAFDRQEREAREAFDREKTERERKANERLQQIQLEAIELDRPERERRLREEMDRQRREAARQDQERIWAEEERQRQFEQQQQERALLAKQEEDARLKAEAEAEATRKKEEEDKRVKAVETPVSIVTVIIAALIGVGIGYHYGGIGLAIFLGLVSLPFGFITGTFLGEGIAKADGWMIGGATGVVPGTIVGGFYGGTIGSQHGIFFAVVGVIVGMIAGVIGGPLGLGIIGSIIAAIVRSTRKVKTA